MRCSIPISALRETPRFRAALLGWFDESRRDLPWRRDADFYRVWLSEIMLQQTRVEAAIPFFNRFLDRFPTMSSLAQAEEAEVLAVWSGLGYYSRARNLHKAAKLIARHGAPSTQAALLQLPGIGPYTAAAIGSIALGLQHASVDGNVMRVVSRLTADPAEISSPATRRRFAQVTQELLDLSRPGDFNQAMMELGATVCTPKNPRCGECPVRGFCAAQAAGIQSELPVKLGKPQPNRVDLHLLLLTGAAPEVEYFLVRRGTAERRLAGFWELPEKKSFPGLRTRRSNSFVHRIVNDRFDVTVWRAAAPARLPDGRWFKHTELVEIPLATITRKAIQAESNNRTGGTR